MTPAPGGRDSRGRIKRSAHAKDDFMRQTGHPHGWPGHVVDHIKPLACGGADDPSNMQWQTVAEGKAKDKVERKGC
ncbi:MAG TPA: HNH endonuclease signature motif containing protein [Gemmatimonadales bacterium]|nr:HNH endonuclease signature motif containing protein [Gemmatimonadales bacterium]